MVLMVTVVWVASVAGPVLAVLELALLLRLGQAVVLATMFICIPLGVELT